MKKKNLLVLTSILLLASCGQTNNPTVEPTAEPTVEPTVKPTQVPTVEPTIEPTVEPTTEPTIEPTVEPTIQPSITPSEPEPTIEPTPEYYVDEFGVTRYNFDESSYEAFEFIDVEDIYLLENETYNLSVMAYEGVDLANVSYFSEIPENISVSEDGILTGVALGENYEVNGTIYVYDENRLQKVNVFIVDYYEYGSYFTSVDKGRLYNKNVVFFGDSITHNWAKYPNGRKPETEEELKWAETTSLGYPTHYIPLLNNVCKFASVTNAAWSGGTMAYLPKSTERFTYKSFPGAIDENQEAVSKADVIFVLYGTNDLTDQVPIGKMSDKMSLSDTSNSSFMAGMQFGIEYIRELNDDANIIFMNLLTRTYTYAGEITLQDYNDAIHEVCKAYMVKELDVNSLFENREFYKYSDDGLHLNPEGYKVLVEYILTRKIVKQ